MLTPFDCFSDVGAGGCTLGTRIRREALGTKSTHAFNFHVVNF